MSNFIPILIEPLGIWPHKRLNATKAINYFLILQIDLPEHLIMIWIFASKLPTHIVISWVVALNINFFSFWVYDAN